LVGDKVKEDVPEAAKKRYKRKAWKKSRRSKSLNIE
jgi:hypothetical protein